LLRTVSELAGAGVRVSSLGEVVDTSAPEGRGFNDCCAVLVAYERALHAERTGAGMAAARSRGRRIGNRTRFFDKERATRVRRSSCGTVFCCSTGRRLTTSLVSWVAEPCWRGHSSPMAEPDPSISRLPSVAFLELLPAAAGTGIVPAHTGRGR